MEHEICHDSLENTPHASRIAKVIGDSGERELRQALFGRNDIRPKSQEEPTNLPATFCLWWPGLCNIKGLNRFAVLRLQII
jgi:hypothetical protein